MSRALPFIFSRTFNVPLCITMARLEPLIAGLRSAAFQRGRLKAADDDDEEDDEEDKEKFPAPWESAFAEDDETWQRDRHGAGYAVSSGGVARLPIRDVLVRRDGQIDANSTELESYNHIGQAIRLAIADPKVKGILLDIDSCGGECGGLFDLCEDIRAAGTIKPVWAMANDDCLSAAYAIASACDQIWTSRTGVLGSVGVVALHTNQAGFDAKQGVEYDYVQAGERKTDFNPHDGLSAEAREALQTEVNRIYGMFVGQVAAWRGMEPEAVAETEAGLFYGENAVTAGLADEIGTFPQAVAAMTETFGEPTMADPVQPTDEDAIAARTTANVFTLHQLKASNDKTRADHAEIANLCEVAKMPQLIGGFIAKGTSVTAVRAEIQRRQEAADNARTTDAIDTTAAKPAGPSEFSKVIGDRFSAQQGKRS